MLASDHEVEHRARQPDGGEQVGGHADHQRDGKAADRPGAVGIQNDAGDERGDMRVEHRPESAPKAGFDGATRTLSGTELFADTFVDDDVGIDRHTDGENDAGDAGQGQGRARQRQDRQLVEDVEHHRDVGDQARDPIVNEHEEYHRDRTDDHRQLGLVDRVLAERRTDLGLEGLLQRRRQRARLQHRDQVLCLLHEREAVGRHSAHGDARPTAADPAFNRRRRVDAIVEDDRHLAANVGAGDLLEDRPALAVEL